MRDIKTSKVSKVAFREVADGQWFESGDCIYVKMKSGDLQFFNINTINAVEIASGGATKFKADEMVNSLMVTDERGKLW